MNAVSLLKRPSSWKKGSDRGLSVAFSSAYPDPSEKYTDVSSINLPDS